MRRFTISPFILCLMLLLAVCSAAHAVRPLYWFQEIGTNLGYYILPLHLVCVGALLLERRIFRWSRAVLLALFLLLSYSYLDALAPFFIGENSANASSALPRPIKIFYANVNAGAAWGSELNAYVAAANPDLVALLEVTPEWQRSFDFEKNYPYSKVVAREDCFGIALFSRLPFASDVTTDMGEKIAPVILVDLEAAPGRIVKTALVHALPPMSNRAINHNRLLLRRVSTILRHYPGEVLAMGDLNATPFSKFYRQFEQGSLLGNVFYGRGLLRTWNRFSWWMRFDIDHVFYRGDFQVHSAKTLDLGDSDHFPIEVVLQPLSGSAATSAVSPQDQEPPRS